MGHFRYTDEYDIDWTETGRRIEYERKQILDGNGKPMTLMRLAELLGRSPSTYKLISRWEKGDAFPTYRDMFGLCSIFDCDIGYLLGEQTHKRKARADIAERTGLSIAAVETLEECVSFRDLHTPTVISMMIENHYALGSFWEIIFEMIDSYCDNRDKEKRRLDAIAGDGE